MLLEGKEDYIYGYLFHSDLGLVIDTGETEYPVDVVELWNGEEYIRIQNLSKSKRASISGCIARIKTKKYRFFYSSLTCG